MSSEPRDMMPRADRAMQMAGSAIKGISVLSNNR